MSPSWEKLIEFLYHMKKVKSKGKSLPRQAEVALGVLGRLRPWIILTFGTTGVVGRQPNAPAAFIPGEILGTHFQRLSRPQGTWFRRGEPRKNPPVTPPGIDPFWLVAQCLNHYTIPSPPLVMCHHKFHVHSSEIIQFLHMILYLIVWTMQLT